MIFKFEYGFENGNGKRKFIALSKMFDKNKQKIKKKMQIFT